MVNVGLRLKASNQHTTCLAAGHSKHGACEASILGSEVASHETRSATQSNPIVILANTNQVMGSHWVTAIVQ